MTGVILDKACATLTVTAFNPVTGRSKTLGAGELRALLETLLLCEKEYAAGQKEAANARLEELGLEPSWFDGLGIRGALFLARKPGWERFGKSLRELLDAAREAGGEEGVGRPQDRLVHVVEDDDSMREMYEFILCKEGFQTDLFADGVEFLEHLRKLSARAPDLVLLDLMLPRRAGYEVLKELQSETPQAQVMIVTARKMSAEAIAALRAEANVADFLAKPFSPAALANTAHRLVRTRSGR